MPDVRDLQALLRSRLPIVVLESREETQAIEALRKASEPLSLPLFTWSVTEGLHRREQGYQPQRHNIQPAEVLSHIKSARQPGIYLLLDFHPYLEDARIVRLFKEIALGAEESRQTLVLLSYRVQLPPELDHLSARIAPKLPDGARLTRLVAEVIDQWARDNVGRLPRLEPGVQETLVRNLSGLSAGEARRLARKALYDDGALTGDDLPGVTRHKYELLNRNGVLSLEPDTARFADVGGLDGLKEWLAKRKAAFQGEHGVPGLPAPKGIMLLGVQGCGKSLAAKAVAGVWDVPLLRLDFGAAYNKFHGETERNIRESLQAADAMAPCVLWIDEMEKGVSTGDDDSGTSRRVLGTLLTWMAEHRARVFLVATANDIQSLPPELVRKGRLDEIFFVDLPDFTTRQEIFAIHLKRRGQKPDLFDLHDLAEASAGFSGAEIEQAVVAGLYSVLGGQKTLDTPLLLAELAQTRSLSVVMAERISALRSWAAGRTVPAH